MERRPTRRSELTDRQREVLALIAAGKTNGEVADALGISLDGAKYHVREIMGRLGVDSREEAAEWWRAHRGVRFPVSSLRRAFAGPLWAWLGGGAAAVAVVGGVVAFELAGTDAKSSDAAPSVTAAPSTTGALAPTPAAAYTHHDPVDVLANGTTVDYIECYTATNWTHPTLDELFAPSSYGRVRLLSPRNGQMPTDYYALFLSSFFYDTFPTAGSANIEPGLLFGPAHAPGITGLGGNCAPSTGPFGANQQDLWLAGYRLLDLKKDGLQLVARVTPTPGVFRDISFTAPVPGLGPPQKDPAGNGMRPFSEVDVLAEDGSLLFRSFSSFDSLQYGDDGELEFATLSHERDSATVHIARAGRYLLYNDFQPGAGTYSATFSVQPVGGATEHDLGIHPPTKGWEPIADVTLDPGDYELRVSGGAGDYLLLPATTPPPVVP